MDFELTDEQRDIRATVAAFARKELNDDLLDRDRRGEFPRDAWDKCAKVGLQGLPVPAEYGGAGAGALTTMLALESLGYGCRDNGLIFSLNAHMWAGEMPVAHFGTEEQKRRYLPRLCDGSLIIGHAMSEPGAGSDTGGLATTATRRGDGYVLRGAKTFVTNAPVAGLLVVFATTDPGRGWPALSAFLVERDTPGLSVGRPIQNMGLRTAPMAEVLLDECPVPGDAVLGPPGAGAAIFNRTMMQERSFILSSAVGTMRRDLERCVEHARQRRQFGRPIGKFQAVADRIVGMRLRLDTAQLLLYRLGWLLDREQPAALEAALTKLHISECFVQSGLDAVQVHGGYGFTAEYEVERDLRDAVGSRLYSGTSEIHKNLVARAMGL